MTIQKTKVADFVANGLLLRSTMANYARDIEFEDSAMFQVLIFKCYEDDPAAAERRGILRNVKQLTEKLDPPMNDAEWKKINED